MKSLLFLLPSLLCFAPPATAREPLPPSHTTRQVEGWSVRIDDRLLEGDKAEVGARALKLLESRLVAVTFVVPEPALAKLRTIVIQLDLDYGGLVPMQYHPDAGWLRDNGYEESLEKCVHIPDIGDFLDPRGIHHQPWVMLHELAHGFHDQVIGFSDPRVLDAWRKFRESGKYKSVPTVSGDHHEHYALTDEKEFFAEMTEAYFGSNDFFPFVAGELKQAEPDVFALLAEIWGALPGHEVQSSSASSEPLPVEEDLAFFEKKYRTKIHGVRPMSEYADPDQFYAAIAEQLGIPEQAREAAARKFNWKPDDGKITKTVVKGGPVAGGKKSAWDVMLFRFAPDPTTGKPNPASIETRFVQIDYDGTVSFPTPSPENH